MHSSELPVAIVGAGPVGLTAAVHLHSRGLPFVILEAGPEPAWGVAEWGHVRLFSPWRFLFDPVARERLEASGWVAPDGNRLPTGDELRQRYLLPLARDPAIAPHLRLNARVQSIDRAAPGDARSGEARSGEVRSGDPSTNGAGPGDAASPFTLRLEGGEVITARAVVDASGTTGTPAPLGTQGTSVPGEDTLGDRVHPGIPAHPGDFRALRTLVLGSGHTAMGAILDLLSAGSPVVHWGIRGPDPHRYLGGGERDQLPARGAIGTRVREAMEAGRVRVLSGLEIHRFRSAADGSILAMGRWVGKEPSGREASGEERSAETCVGGTCAGDVRTEDAPMEFSVDRIIRATGYRPDLSLTERLRLSLDPELEAPVELAPMIDPKKHSCGTVPRHGVTVLTHPHEPGFYTVGMKSYGRAPTFLMKTGFEQVRSVAARLAGDEEAATTIQMELPSTGVCRTDFVEPELCC